MNSQMLRHRRTENSSVQTSIHDLPKQALVCILSFLPTPTAVKTTLIGRSWRNLWHSATVLHFDMFDFHCTMPDKSISEVQGLFIELVNLTLFHFPPKSPLRAFTLSFSYVDPMFPIVNSWVRFALGCKPVKLNLRFQYREAPPNPAELDEEEEDGDDDVEDEGANDVEDDDSENEGAIHVEDYYDFDFSYLINSSVEVVNLCACHIYAPERYTTFDSIREMHLTYCVMTNMEGLITKCVNLEILSLVWEFHLSRLKIVNSKLKHFKLRQVGDNMAHSELREDVSLKMHAPSLESIDFCLLSAKKYVLIGASSLTVARVKFQDRNWLDFVSWSNVLSITSGVERLTIQNMWSWFMGESTARNSEWNKWPEGRNHNWSLGNRLQLRRKAQLGEAVLSESFAFHKLKHLELLTGYLINDLLGLEVLLNKCPLLMTLILVYKYRSHLDEPLETQIRNRPIALHMPHIRLVKMKDYRGTRNELYVVGLLKKHGFALEKIVAYPAGDGAISQTPFVL